MLPLLLALALSGAAKPLPPPRPLVVTTLQGDDADDVEALTLHLREALERNPGLIVSTRAQPCADEACAQSVAPEHGYVVFGRVDHSGDLIVVDLHLFDVDKGTAAMRAKLEAPELSILQKQIDEAAVLMLGGEPSSSLSPVIVGGGIAAGVGLLAMGVGGLGYGYSVFAKEESLEVPSMITIACGAIVLVGGVVVVGLAIEE
ncbi:MAG: hypothetical protein Q8O67_09125 [Deltaproteobacteria bacterium]|nr:hypothetical protein [Deltaproteobacteria bacterium]